jgi:membrane associated rhomboid family serine protease
MFPYADDTPSYSFPFWIVLLIVVNAIVFIMSMSGGGEGYTQTIFSYGTIPARFFQPAGQHLDLSSQLKEMGIDFRIDQSKFALPLITLFTSMFLHGGFMHILGNMWFLWIFGDNVEDRFGKIIFPFFYILCGLLAGVLHVVFLHNSVVPAIGASGAIAGVMGAYIYMFPRSTVATIIGFGFYFQVIHIPSSIFLGLWFVLQLFGGLAGGDASNVAFWAHVGGFVAGLLLAMLLSAAGLVGWAEGDRGRPGPAVPAFYD